MSVSKVKHKTTQLYIAAFISLSNKMQAHCHYASGPMGPLTVSLYSLTRFCFSDYVCLSFFDLYLFFCTWCMCLRFYTLGLIYCLVSLFTILLFSLNRSSINCFKDFRFSPEDLFCVFFLFGFNKLNLQVTFLTKFIILALDVWSDIEGCRQYTQSSCWLHFDRNGLKSRPNFLNGPVH